MGNFFENFQYGLSETHKNNVMTSENNYHLYDEAPSLVNDSETDEFLKWYKSLDSNLSAETKDYLVQNYWNKQAEQRAFERDMYKSDTQYQRTVRDISAAGLNPFLALQGLGGSTPTSGSSSVQGGLYSGREKQRMSTTGSAAAAVIAALALIAVKLLAK